MKRRDDELTFWTGEYVYPWSVWYPAEWLLHSMHDVSSDALLALRDDVGKQVTIDFDPLAVYTGMRRHLARIYRHLGPTLPVSRLMLCEWSPGPVWDWAERFNLYRPRPATEPEVPITEVAFYFSLATLVALTLKDWAESPSRRAARKLARLPVFQAEDDPLVCEGRDDEEVIIRLPAFAPSAETEADFLRRVAAAAKNHSAYRVRAGGASLRRAGAKSPPQRLEAEHFRWLALFQVGGLSYPAIRSRVAEESEFTLQGVRQGVRRAASLVVGEAGGWLRPALD